MILTEMVELKKPVYPKKIETEIQKREEDFSNWKKLSQTLSIRAETVRDTQTRVEEEVDDTRFESFLKYGNAPVSKIRENRGALDRLIEAPKVQLSGLRNLADRLGFVIVPQEYVDSRSYEKESKNTQKAIENFHNYSAGFDVYTLTPLSNYSLQAQVLDNEDRQLYVSQPHQAAFVNLNMTLPVLKTIFADLNFQKEEIKNLKGRVSNLEERVKVAEQNIKTVASSVTALQNQFAQQQKQMALQEARNREMMSRISDLESRRANDFIMQDPLMFLIPKGTDLSQDDCFATVGPCWGPDLDDMIGVVLGYTPNPEQRKLLAAKTAELFLF